MREKQFTNCIGQKRLICVALLLFILIGSGIAHAATDPGEDMQANPTDGAAPSAALAKPADTTAYQGSNDAFSFFYDPVTLWCALGAVIVLLAGYVLVRKSRGKA